MAELMREIMATMNQKRNGVRFGDIVINTLIDDTTKRMDQWTLYTVQDDTKPVVLTDDILSMLKG